jgi:very-short-patch-repair endonuclease
MNNRKDNPNNQPHLIEKRKLLRKNLTSAEATLWLCLKNKQLNGKRFRRQYSFGNFILDFYCPELKLAIELDGKDHFTAVGAEKDVNRDEFLKEHGITVLRFENKLVFEQLEGVLNEIKSKLT